MKLEITPLPDDPDSFMLDLHDIKGFRCKIKLNRRLHPAERQQDALKQVLEHIELVMRARLTLVLKQLEEG